MNITPPPYLHRPFFCPCPACKVAATPTGAANIAAWNGYAAAFPDPFTPTAKETAAALNEDGDGFFDLLAFDPFAAEATPLLTNGEWPCCPWHGFHEADRHGNALDYCERCERRN